jgi:hypothetical protein
MSHSSGEKAEIHQVAMASALNEMRYTETNYQGDEAQPTAFGGGLGFESRPDNL